MWFLEHLASGTAVYHIANGATIHGDLDVDALVYALHALHDRHESLRTRFSVRDGVPVPEVVDLPLEVGLHDLRAMSESERVLRLAEIEQTDRRPFDLAAGPLWRASLVRIADNSWRLWTTFHHIISDGWSMRVIRGDLDELYTARVTGRAPNLPAQPIVYADYAAWQRGRLQGERFVADLGFWTEHLRDANPVELPRVRPAPGDLRDGVPIPFALPMAIGERLRAICLETDTTPFTALLAAFKLLLARYSGTSKIAVATPVAGRLQRETRNVVGLFVNTLLLNTDLDGAQTYRELLAREREIVLDGLAHKEVPFDRVAAALRPLRPRTTAPLINVMFMLNNMWAPMVLGDLQVDSLSRNKQTALDLELTVNTRPDSSYAAELVSRRGELAPTLVEQLARHLQRVIQFVVEDPDRSLTELDLLSSDEHAQLAAWNATARPVEGSQLVHQLVAARATDTPDAIAVEDAHQQLTYRELVTRVDRVAGWLSTHGVSRGSHVTVAVTRSVDMVAAILGVLSVGAAYVPIDPEFPDHRRELMGADAGAAVELDDVTRAAALASDAEPPRVELSEDDVAYVLYTSGSTGVPKGVRVPHRAVVNFLRSMQRVPGITANDTLLAVTTLSFDIAGLEIFLPLITGAKVVIADRDTVRDGDALARLLDTSAATIMQATPATWRMLLATGWRPPAHLTILCGGEALPPDLAAALLASAGALWNLYGPTETTIWSTVDRVQRDRPISIGRPIDNTTIYILDDHRRPVPIGVAGELYIGGRGVALGYHQRPELTAERFLDDPFAPVGARMYRTGDLARWTHGGTLEHLGRLDSQIKLRGFRIELGEVETALRASALVDDAAVILREDVPGNPQLVAYVITASDAALTTTLKATLKTTLPGYMIPSVFVTLPAFPLTPNGKLDRKALPAPDRASTNEYVAPRTSIELQLAAIWRDLLGIERVGVHDDFFALGGHSLLAIRVVALLRAKLGREIPLRLLFEASTLETLAHAIEHDVATETNPPLPPLVARPRIEHPPLSFAQERLWILHQLAPDSRAYHLGHTRRVDHLDVDAFRRAFEALAARHEILRTSYPAIDGAPYQRVHAPAPWHLSVKDARGFSPDAQLAFIAEREHLVRRPFDRATTPPLRVELVRVSDTAHVLLLAMHHILSDGGSDAVLWRDLWAYYDAFAAGRDAPNLPPLPLQYADFAAWQRAWLAGPELDRQLALWTAQLAGAPGELTLPFRGPRPTVQTFAGDRVSTALPAALTDDLRALAHQHGATLFMTFAAALRAILTRYAGQADIVLGAPIDNRTHPELDALVGMFPNTIALRAEVRPDDSFASLLAREKATAVAAYEHQHTPFERVVDALHLERSGSRTPVFQVMYQHVDRASSPSRGSYVDSHRAAAAQFDLTVVTRLRDGRLELDLTYNTDLVDSRLVAQLARNL
ncbi:hypothetical protein BH11MYX2_BH11MYX2_20680 [soil metagenome]